MKLRILSTKISVASYFRQLSVLLALLPVSSFSLNLINPLVLQNPPKPYEGPYPEERDYDPKVLKVGAKNGYIVAFGRYEQDVDPENPESYLTQPIAWRILDSENLDYQSNLRATNKYIEEMVKLNHLAPSDEHAEHVWGAVNSRKILRDASLYYGDAKGLTLLSQRVLDNTGRFADSNSATSSDWRDSDVQKFLNEDGFKRNSDGKAMSFYTNPEVFTPSEKQAISQPTIATVLHYSNEQITDSILLPSTKGETVSLAQGEAGATFFDTRSHIFTLSSDEMAGDLNKRAEPSELREEGQEMPAVAYNFDVDTNHARFQANPTRSYASDYVAQKSDIFTCEQGGSSNCVDDDEQSTYSDKGANFWLRSPGRVASLKTASNGKAAILNADGTVLVEGNAASSSDTGIRPALLTNSDAIIFLQDTKLDAPWSSSAMDTWRPLYTLKSPLPEIPSWVGVNEARRSDDTLIYDTGADHILKPILKANKAHAAALGLGEVTYIINNPGTDNVIDISIQIDRIEESYLGYSAYIDQALLTVPEINSARQEEGQNLEDLSCYTYYYPYVTKTRRLDYINNSAETYNITVSSSDLEQNSRFLVFQHAVLNSDDRENAEYLSEYGNGVLELDVSRQEKLVTREIKGVRVAPSSDLIISTIDANLVVSENASVALSENIGVFNHSLTLNGGTLEVLGPISFVNARLDLSGTLNLNPSYPIELPANVDLLRVVINCNQTENENCDSLISYDDPQPMPIADSDFISSQIPLGSESNGKIVYVDPEKLPATKTYTIDDTKAPSLFAEQPAFIAASYINNSHLEVEGAITDNNLIVQVNNEGVPPLSPLAIAAASGVYVDSALNHIYLVNSHLVNNYPYEFLISGAYNINSNAFANSVTARGSIVYQDYFDGGVGVTGATSNLVYLELLQENAGQGYDKFLAANNAASVTGVTFVPDDYESHDLNVAGAKVHANFGSGVSLYNNSAKVLNRVDVYHLSINGAQFYRREGYSGQLNLFNNTAQVNFDDGAEIGMIASGASSGYISRIPQYLISPGFIAGLYNQANINNGDNASISLYKFTGYIGDTSYMAALNSAYLGKGFYELSYSRYLSGAFLEKCNNALLKNSLTFDGGRYSYQQDEPSVLSLEGEDPFFVLATGARAEAIYDRTMNIGFTAHNTLNLKDSYFDISLLETSNRPVLSGVFVRDFREGYAAFTNTVNIKGDSLSVRSANIIGAVTGSPQSEIEEVQETEIEEPNQDESRKAAAQFNNIVVGDQFNPSAPALKDVGLIGAINFDRSDFSAAYNSINIYGGIFEQDDITGAFNVNSPKAAAVNNMVYISGGTFKGNIITGTTGDFLESLPKGMDAAMSSIVIIAGGLFAEFEGGGLEEEARYNHIITSRGTSLEPSFIRILGSSDDLDLSYAKLYGHISLSPDHKLQKDISLLKGDYLLEAEDEDVVKSPATIIIGTDNVTAKSVSDFDAYAFSLPSVLTTEPMLTVIDPLDLTISLDDDEGEDSCNAEAYLKFTPNFLTFNANDKIILIRSLGGITGTVETTSSAIEDADITYFNFYIESNLGIEGYPNAQQLVAIASKDNDKITAAGDFLVTPIEKDEIIAAVNPVHLIDKTYTINQANPINENVAQNASVISAKINGHSAIARQGNNLVFDRATVQFNTEDVADLISDDDGKAPGIVVTRPPVLLAGGAFDDGLVATKDNQINVLGSNLTFKFYDGPSSVIAGGYVLNQSAINNKANIGAKDEIPTTLQGGNVDVIGGYIKIMPSVNKLSQLLSSNLVLQHNSATINNVLVSNTEAESNSIAAEQGTSLVAIGGLIDLSSITDVSQFGQVFAPKLNLLDNAVTVENVSNILDTFTVIGAFCSEVPLSMGSGITYSNIEAEGNSVFLDKLDVSSNIHFDDRFSAAGAVNLQIPTAILMAQISSVDVLERNSVHLGSEIEANYQKMEVFGADLRGGSAINNSVTLDGGYYAFGRGLFSGARYEAAGYLSIGGAIQPLVSDLAQNPDLFHTQGVVKDNKPERLGAWDASAIHNPYTVFSQNTLTINGGEYYLDSDGSGIFSGALLNEASVYTDDTGIRSITNNSVKIKKASFKGLSDDGLNNDALFDKFVVIAGCIFSFVDEDNSAAEFSEGHIEYNEVTIDAGTQESLFQDEIAAAIFGAATCNPLSCRSSAVNTVNFNKVIINSGIIKNSYIYGASNAVEDYLTHTSFNRVEIRGGVFRNCEIIGAHLSCENSNFDRENIIMDGNGVIISNGIFEEYNNICAIEFSHEVVHKGDILANNFIKITGSAPKLDLSGANLIGGVTFFEDADADSSTSAYKNNKLIVDTSGVTANSVEGFNEIQFVLPSALPDVSDTNTPPMLTLLEALDLKDVNLSLDPDINITRYTSGARLVLLEAPVISGFTEQVYGDFYLSVESEKDVNTNNKLVLTTSASSAPTGDFFSAAIGIDDSYRVAYVDPNKLPDSGTYIISSDEDLPNLPQAVFITSSYDKEAVVTNKTLQFGQQSRVIDEKLSIQFQDALNPVVLAGAVSTIGASNNKVKVYKASLEFYYNAYTNELLPVNNALIGAFSLGGNLTNNSAEIIGGNDLDSISWIGGSSDILGAKLVPVDNFSDFSASNNQAIIQNTALNDLYYNSASFNVAGVAMQHALAAEPSETYTFRAQNNAATLNRVNIGYGGLRALELTLLYPIDFMAFGAIDFQEPQAFNVAFSQNQVTATSINAKVNQIVLNGAASYLSSVVASNNSVLVSDSTSINANTIRIAGASIARGSAIENAATINTTNTKSQIEAFTAYYSGAEVELYSDAEDKQAAVRANILGIQSGVFNAEKFMTSDFAGAMIFEADHTNSIINENEVRFAGGRIVTVLRVADELANSSKLPCVIAGVNLKSGQLYGEVKSNGVTIGGSAVAVDLQNHTIITGVWASNVASSSDLITVLGEVSDNFVTIESGTLRSPIVFGALVDFNEGSKQGTLEIANNLVTINDGNFTNMANTPRAVQPTLYAAGAATIVNAFSADKKLSLKNNGVIINGGTWDSRFFIVAAGSAIMSNTLNPKSFDDPVMEDNFIKIEGTNTNLVLNNIDLLGAAISEDNIVPLPVWPKNSSGSKLIVATDNVNANSINLFDEIQFVLPAQLNAANPMLVLNQSLDLNFEDENSVARPTLLSIDATTNKTNYHVGDSMVLLRSSVGIQHFNSVDLGDFAISLNKGKDLVLTVLQDSPDPEPEPTPVEPVDVVDKDSLATSTRGVAAGATQVNDAMDLVASNLTSQLTSAATTSGMMASSVGSSKVTTGSHVKSFGGSLVLGASKGYEHTTVGVFVEGGLSHFDSYETVKTGYGNSKFAGLGAMLKFDSKSAYLTTMIHGGAVRTKAGFKTNTAYLGGFAELGWHLGKYLDFYTRYSYSRSSSIEEVVGVQRVMIDPTESHRGRVGFKLNLADSSARPYLGVAFEREFKGETKGVVVGEGMLASPTIKGNSGVIELGVELELSKILVAHLNAESFFGRRQGFSGGVGLEFKL